MPDGFADVVVAGQAYHWFDPAPAHAEIARVLRPGGVFVPLWNILDLSVPWQAELTRVSEDDTAGRGTEPPEIGSLGPAYGPVERRRFRHAVWHTADSLVGLVATRSYYLTSPPARQREIDRRVRDLCATHPDLAGRDRFPLNYLTDVYRIPTVPRPSESSTLGGQGPG